jgi:hypothetical protein
VFCSSSHSTVKSGSTWDLMTFLFSYVMVRGESLILHKETRHVASELFRIFDSGASLTTTIGCTAKYCRNFRDVVNTLYHEKGIK